MKKWCHNRKPYADAFGSFAIDSQSGEVRYFVVPNPNSKDCKHTLTPEGQADAGCQGCKWRKEK